MNKEEEFKELLNDKLNSVEFGFDEAAWHGANDLLNKYHQQKKDKPWFLYLAALFILTGVGFGVYLLLPSSGQTTATAKTANTKQPDVNESLEKQEIITPHETNEVTNNKAIKEVNVTQPQNGNAEINVKPGLTESVSGKVYQPTASNEGKLKDVAGVNNGVNNATKITTNHTNQEDDKTPGGVKISGQEKSEDNTKVAESTIVLNETPAGYTYEYLPSLSSFDKWNISSTEAEANLTGLTFDENIPYKKSIRKISVEGGVNYMFGWNNHGTRDANGLNPLIGINYSYIPSRKLFYVIGLQYYSIAHLSYSKHISKATHYSLGEESSVFEVTPTKIHYLALPFKLSWKYNNNFVFGAGATPAYMLTVTSTVETYNLKVNKRNDYTKSKTTGYTEGFKPFDAQLSVFAKYKLYKNLEGGIEFYYGLIDQKSNSFFNSTVKETNKGLKFTLTYDILSR